MLGGGRWGEGSDGAEMEEIFEGKIAMEALQEKEGRRWAAPRHMEAMRTAQWLGHGCVLAEASCRALATQRPRAPSGG